ARASRHRRRPAPLLPPDLPLRVVAGEPRRLPASGDGALLRRPAPRGADHRVRDRRARADPDRNPDRLGRAPLPEAAARSRPRSVTGLAGDGFRLGRATLEYAGFLAELAGHDDVDPFLSVRRARDPEAVREEIERSLAEPAESGRFVIEVEENGDWRRAGAM